MTDILTERYGLNGLLWCINKYVFRFKNLRRERDLLKIGAYMYILWLKFGYHLERFNTEASINTTVETKLKYLDSYIAKLNMYQANRAVYVEGHDTVHEADLLIHSLSYTRIYSPWILYEVTSIVEELYNQGNYDGSDADTYNETGGNKSGQKT